MSNSLLEAIVRLDVPLLAPQDTIAVAVARIMESGLPALPVVDGAGALEGIFGEREFLGAVFPGYVKELKFARFLPSSLDAALEHRACAHETISAHVNREHVEIAHDASDVQAAEVFLHHRVLVLPVLRDKQVVGVITRSDFFRGLAQRLIDKA